MLTKIWTANVREEETGKPLGAGTGGVGILRGASGLHRGIRTHGHKHGLALNADVLVSRDWRVVYTKQNARFKNILVTRCNLSERKWHNGRHKQ
jgi:hypothetical protein